GLGSCRPPSPARRRPRSPSSGEPVRRGGWWKYSPRCPGARFVRGGDGTSGRNWGEAGNDRRGCSRRRKRGHRRVSDRASSALLGEEVGVHSEILGLLGGALEAHDPIRFEERAVQAADGNANPFAVFPRQWLRRSQNAVFIDSFDGDCHGQDSETKTWNAQVSL